MVNKESNLTFPFTYNESFKVVTLLTVKLLSINTFPLTLNESLMVNKESNLTNPFTYKLESIFTFPLAKIESETYNLLFAKIL